VYESYVYNYLTVRLCWLPLTYPSYLLVVMLVISGWPNIRSYVEGDLWITFIYY